MGRYVVVVGILSVLVCGYAFGDGCHFPVRGIKAVPAIESQRAVVVYRDGIETLVIESALYGDSEEFGWVIPLPARPEEFEVASSGFIDTLSLTTQPEVIHSLILLPAVVVFSIVTLAWFMLVVFCRENKSKSHFIIQFILLLLLVLLLLSVLMPSLGAGGYVAVKGVSVVESEEVGSFGLAVLEGVNAGAVNEWLEVNGFIGLDDRGLKIVEEYIAEGWCFVAARLKRSGYGYGVPHPLSMRFASEEAVYPMKLTAMAESDVYLELFVIAESGVKTGGLKLEFRETYEEAAEAPKDTLNEKNLSGFVCADKWSAIGHPEASKYMWDGCVLSRLAGTIGAYEMDQDIVLEEAKESSYRRRYYSIKGALQSAVVYGLAVWCVLMIALTTINLKKIQKIDGWKVAFKNIFFGCFIAGAIVGVYVFMWGEIVEVGGLSRPVWLLDVRGRHDIENVEGELYSADEDFADMQVEEVREYIEKYISAEGIENRFSGKVITFEDSPGNFSVFEDGRGVVVRGYLAGGFSVDIVLIEDLSK